MESCRQIIFQIFKNNVSGTRTRTRKIVEIEVSNGSEDIEKKQMVEEVLENGDRIASKKNSHKQVNHPHKEHIMTITTRSKMGSAKSGDRWETVSYSSKGSQKQSGKRKGKSKSPRVKEPIDNNNGGMSYGRCPSKITIKDFLKCKTKDQDGEISLPREVELHSKLSGNVK